VKDRTGLLVALLLGLAGVPDELIVEDYALTEACLRDAPGFAHHRRMAEAAGRADYLASPPELMRATLQYLAEQDGGIIPYLHRIGIPVTTITTLQSILVEDSANA
jgi:protein-tyrosine phosphatase